ncbi:hypothetical protein [Streptomyces sp. V1I6]|uniref:hypothetical protein n=1 Tax=Streptomyces sp. V1I6 TaxID=3042273 RepID=UPI0027823E99|nr:hypothetical protein [Streptomyces sp. V1I6]MDQ0847428.1 hypothetical protein [Streptomyces sp. V1I6]
MKHSQLLHNRRPLGATLAALLCLPLAPITLLATTTPAAADETTPTAPQARPEAFAYDEAARTGQRIEVIDRRQETLEVFANPDGTTTQRSYGTPVWTRLDGTWRKTDATLKQQADGTIAPAAPSFGITFSGGGNAPLATMTKQDKKLTLTWPAPLPQPVLDQNTALYKSVLPGVDLKVTAEVDGFAEHLIVNTREAAANPALKAIELGIAAEGLDVTVDASDSITATDADGTVVFSAPRPKMWEAPPAAEASTKALRTSAATAAADGEVPQTAPVAVDIEGETLTLTPDATLLSAADQFPLVIDPVFTGGYREKWAVVYSATPNDAYPNGSGWYSDTPDDEPRVGYNGSGRTRSFFAMNTTGLAGADILDATFAVTQTHSWGCTPSQAGETELWSTGDITNTPTWNNQDLWASKIASGSYAHGNPTFCPGNEGFDYKSTALTNYVKQAASSGWGALTFGLRAEAAYESNVNSYKRLTNNPALEVTYNFKPTVSNAGAFEGNWSDGADGNKPVPCGDVIGNSGLALKATLTDKDRGNVTPEFEVATAAGTSIDVDNGSKVASGRTATATVSSVPLVTGAYKWRVRAKDDEGTYSPYSAWCTFTVDEVGPVGAVRVTAGNDDLADDNKVDYQARSSIQLTLFHKATDLAGFCWAMDHYVSVASTRCANGTWVPAGPGGTATITVKPAGYPNSTFYVLAFDKADNHSPFDGATDAYTIHTTPAPRIYAPGTDPTSGLASADLHGDLTGDGYVDMVATDTDAKLRLYAGNGTGQVAAPTTVGTSGWTGALIAHGGDYKSLLSPTASPDGYEDFLVRLSNGQLYAYPNNGFGTPWIYTRDTLPHPMADPDTIGGWEGLRQIIAPGDIDRNQAPGHYGGKDMITIECSDTACSNADLWLYSGNTIAGGGANQAEPFDMFNRRKIGTGGWKNLTNLSVGDQNGDGTGDLLTRDPSTGTLYLYPGQIDSAGVYTLGSRTVYGNAGWDLTRRPLLTSPGNIQGSVVDATVQDPDTGETSTFRQFQPTTGEAYGDFWATTPADPNYTVNYVGSNGAAASTTCPTGCLLFYPGGPTTHRSPRLVGSGAWSTTITGIF